MNGDYLRLVTDTLSFLKEEKSIQLTLPTPKKLPLPSPIPITPPAKLEVKPSPIPEQIAKESALKRHLPSLFEKIQKHLPHLQLIQKIPSVKQVALIISQKEDFPFFQTLKLAIQKQNCLVKCFELEKIEQGIEWNQFDLILTQKEMKAKNQIILAPIISYQNDIEQKKFLWAAILRAIKPT